MMAGDRKFSPADAGYVEVKDRIIAFYEKHPQGSLQSEIVEFGENIVVLKGYAYRTPDDPRPGIGHSQMPIPGKTSFTRDSEIENAETSAWGRAIAALGFEVKRSIASSDEVAMKADILDERPTDAVAFAGPDTRPATPAQKSRLMAQGKKLFGDQAGVTKFVSETVGKFKSADLTRDDIQILFESMDSIEATLDAAASVASE